MKIRKYIEFEINCDGKYCGEGLNCCDGHDGEWNSCNLFKDDLHYDKDDDYCRTLRCQDCLDTFGIEEEEENESNS